MSRTSGNALLALLVVAIGAFQIAMLRDGFQWFHDSVGYVNHAENLAAGRDYAESGYLPNPFRYIAPKAYPPGYPLLLLPVVKVFGADTRVLRIESVIILLGVLVAVGALARDRLPLPYLAVLLGAVGLSPVFWENLQRLLSDIPFLLFVVLSLLAYRDASGASGRGARWARGALTGGLVFCAVMTRAIGVVLIPAIVLHELLRFRFRRLTVVAVAMTGTFALLQAAETVSPFARAIGEAEEMTDVPPNPWRILDGSVAAGGTAPADSAAGSIAAGATAPADSVALPLKYRHSHATLLLNNVFRHASRVPKRLARNVAQYARWGSEFVDNGRAPLLGKGLFLAAVGLGLAGFVHRLRDGRRVCDVFAVLYFLALLPWSFAERRYLFPLAPLAGVYVLTGVMRLAEAVRARPRWAVLATSLVIAATYASRYTTLDLGPFPDAYSGTDAEAFYDFVEESTAPDEVLLSEYPRQLAYFTGRRVAAPHIVLDERTWWPYMLWLGARFVVVGPARWPGVDDLAKFVDSSPAEFEKVFERGSFRVYRMHPPPGS